MSWFNFSFHDFALAFLSVLVEGVPFLVVGSLISGFIDVFVSSERVARLLPGNRGGAILAAGALGLVFPMCECGSVIIIRRFLKKGLPLSCAVAYMLGAPIVSPIVALSTWQAFQNDPAGPLPMTVLRLLMGYMLAVGTAFVIDRLPLSRIVQPGLLGGSGAGVRRTGLNVAAAPTEGEVPMDFSKIVAGASFPRKVLLALQSATSDFLDVAFFFVIGVGVTSVFNTGVNQAALAPFAEEPLVAILSLQVLASVLALCSTTDAFVAWTFTAFPATAKLAFLVFGPMFDLKLFWLYGLIFRRRMVVGLGATLFVVVALLCWRIPPEVFDAKDPKIGAAKNAGASMVVALP